MSLRTVDLQDLDKAIDKLRFFFKNKPVIKAYLFGSVVRGVATPSSDVDILVELDYSKSIGLQFVQMKMDLEELLNLKVDLISTNALSKRIKPYVDIEKQLIYVR